VLSPPSAAIARLRRGFVVALEIALLSVLVVAFFLRMPEVSGLSMEPRIGSGEYVLIDTIAYRFSPIRRGDIVAFRPVARPQESYLKRIIALPGERVGIVRGVVLIDGKPLPETYVRYRDGRTLAERTVPPDSYYVLGDNRANSDDSRDWGFVPRSSIFGKASFALWPLGRFGRI